MRGPPPLIAQLTLLLSLIALSLLMRANASTEDLKIPNLGESSTSLFSADYEYEIGRMWLRSFRGQAPLVNDPLLHSYLENLTFELAQHSDLRIGVSNWSLSTILQSTRSPCPVG